MYLPRYSQTEAFKPLCCTGRFGHDVKNCVVACYALCFHEILELLLRPSRRIWAGFAVIAFVVFMLVSSGDFSFLLKSSCAFELTA